MGECTIRCGESSGSPVGFGLGNRRDRSIRGGRSLRLELLEPLECTDWEDVSGLDCLPFAVLSLESAVAVSRELK